MPLAATCMLLCSRCHAESGRTGTPCHLRLCFAVPGVWALAAMACAVTRRVAPRLHVSAWLHVPAHAWCCYVSLVRCTVLTVVPWCLRMQLKRLQYQGGSMRQQQHKAGGAIMDASDPRPAYRYPAPGYVAVPSAAPSMWWLACSHVACGGCAVQLATPGAYPQRPSRAHV